MRWWGGGGHGPVNISLLYTCIVLESAFSNQCGGERGRDRMGGGGGGGGGGGQDKRRLIFMHTPDPCKAQVPSQKDSPL